MGSLSRPATHQDIRLGIYWLRRLIVRDNGPKLQMLFEAAACLSKWLFANQILLQPICLENLPSETYSPNLLS